MPRIPEDELARLKSDIPLVRLVGAKGFETVRHGAKDWAIRCPFHESDDSPSCIISPDKNQFHCFACDAGGDVIEWVKRIEGVSFRHAVEILRRDYPTLTSVLVGKPPAKASVPKLPCPLPREADDQELLNQVAELYRETFELEAAPKEYLAGRGLDPALLAPHKLGYANRTLGYRLPEKNRVAGADLRGRLQQLGILRESGHEHLAGSLVVPLVDAKGNVVQMYGRKLLDNLRPGTAKHLNLPGPLRGVWNEQSLVGQREVILCEGLIDAMTFWCAGFANVTASLGVGGFTDEHLATFKRVGVERVLIAYDRDDAGDTGAKALSARLLTEGFGCYRVLFPHGMDANAYALKVQPATKSLGLVVRNAVWMGSGAAPARETAPASAPESVRPLAAKEETEIDAAACAPEAPVVPPVVPPASPEPPPQAVDVPTEVEGDEVSITLGDRRYRVRGLQKNTSYEVLKINLLCAREDAFHVDTLDLYVARQREMFVNQAAKELGLKGREEVIKKDLAKVLGKLEELQDAHIKAVLAPKEPAVVVVPEGRRKAAMELLQDPRLLDRILEDFGRCGMVGEEVNKLTGYLGAVSRKLEDPLAIIVQSSTAAGKTALMDAILAFMPKEDRVKYSAMTGQSLFYMGDKDLKHKILAIVEQEGASRASYALKLLQSEGEITIASTGKDPLTGKLVTNEYRVTGPVMIFLTSTAIEIDEELLNRCLILTVNEDREQTRAIHRLQRQRRTLEGWREERERAAILELHEDAQRLLRPLRVVNPYANELTFLDTKTRTRRDHMKYLSLIDATALLMQYQREVKTDVHRGEAAPYIEVTPDDIAVANRLAGVVLGRTLDELPPQTRTLLLAIDGMVTEGCAREGMARQNYRFTRRLLRERTGWGDTQLKTHLGRLQELEYLLAHRAPRGQGYEYELVYDGQGKDGEPFLIGLIDVATLEGAGTTAERSGQNGPRSGVNDERSGPGRPPVGGWSGGGRGAPIGLEATSDKGFDGSSPDLPENAYRGPEGPESYVTIGRTRSSARPDPAPVGGNGHA